MRRPMGVHIPVNRPLSSCRTIVGLDVPFGLAFEGPPILFVYKKEQEDNDQDGRESDERTILRPSATN